MAAKNNRQRDKEDKETEEVYRMDAAANRREELEELADNILFQQEQKIRN